MNVACPYCGASAELVGGNAIYPHLPDLKGKSFWMCAPCAAWVGCHDGTENPLGRLAKEPLRRAKNKAHAAFDPVWKTLQQLRQCSKGKARGASYAWLAKQLGVAPKLCHIGLFDIADCERVRALCEPIHVRLGATHADDLLTEAYAEFDRVLAGMGSEIAAEQFVLHGHMRLLIARKIARDLCPVSEGIAAGYGWLAKQINMPAEACRLDILGLEDCRRAIDACMAVHTPHWRAAA